MCDVHDAQALRLQSVNHFKKSIHFTRVKAGGGFIQNEQFGLDIEGTGDGCQVLNRRRARTQRPIDIQL